MKKFLLFSVLIFIVCGLAACTPRVEDIQKKYEENDFEIKNVSADDYGLDNDDITYAFKAVKEGETEATVISFSDGNTASEFYNKQYRLKDETSELIKKGNTVIFGSKDAVKLAGNK